MEYAIVTGRRFSYCAVDTADTSYLNFESNRLSLQFGRPRSAVHFVLLGLRYSRVDWTTPSLDAADLADAFAGNVIRLAAAAQMALTPDEESAQQEAAV